MPTTTFLNLPKEKQNKIIEASKKEFGRVLLKDASINKIIKDAEISRGSFYTYFKDINDLYIYSLKKYKQQFQKILSEELEDTKGDLIKTTKQVYDKIIYNYGKEKDILKNIFLNMNYNISIRTRIECETLEEKYKILELINKIDKKSINIETEEELIYIIDIIIGFVIHGLIEIFIDNKDPETIKQKIEKQLEILQKGISRR